MQDLSEVPRPTVPLTTPPVHPVAGAVPPVVEAEGDPRAGPQYRAALELEVWKEEKEKEFMAEVGRNVNCILGKSSPCRWQMCVCVRACVVCVCVGVCVGMCVHA